MTGWAELIQAMRIRIQAGMLISRSAATGSLVGAPFVTLVTRRQRREIGRGRYPGTAGVHSMPPRPKALM